MITRNVYGLIGEGLRESTRGRRTGCSTRLCLVSWEYGQRECVESSIGRELGMKCGIGYGGEEEECKSENHLPAYLVYLLPWQVWLVGYW